MTLKLTFPTGYKVEIGRDGIPDRAPVELREIMAWIGERNYLPHPWLAAAEEAVRTLGAKLDVQGGARSAQDKEGLPLIH